MPIYDTVKYSTQLKTGNVRISVDFPSYYIGNIKSPDVEIES